MTTASDLRWMWLALAFVVTAFSQLCAQLVLGRLLGAGTFGEVATLYGLMNFVGVPLVAVQLTVTALVARGGSVRPTLRRYALWGLAAGAVALVAAPAWAGALALPSLAACQVAAWFLPATFLVSVARGNTVGQSRTEALAAAMCVAAVVRLVASIVGANLFGVTGAAAAAVGSEVVLALILFAVVRPRGEDRGPVVSAATARATYVQTAAWIIVNVDLLWARRLLDPAGAGRYLLVGSLSVGLVAFGQAFLWHRASNASADSVSAAIVWRSAGIVAAVAVVAVPVGLFTVPVLAGPTFSGLGPLMVMGGLWAVVASVVFTSTATQIIAGEAGLWRIVPTALFAIVAPPISVATFGGRPVALAGAALASTTTGAFVMFGPQVLGARRASRMLPVTSSEQAVSPAR